MILQRDLPIAVFGEGDGPVTLSLAGAQAQAMPENGRFLAWLPPLPAGGPFRLTVRCAGETLTLSDVWIGEVWLCGGQSNMEFRLRDAATGPRDLAADRDPLLRWYEVPAAVHAAEAEEKERFAAWRSIEPNHFGDLSAVAYYAAKELRACLDVPVGLVVCCLGGTTASCWLSEEALNRTEAGRNALAAFHREADPVTPERFAAETAAYERRVADYCRQSDALKAEGCAPAEIIRRIGDFPWPPPAGPYMLRRPAGPWENQVCRILPLTVRGLFWYQGESDAGEVRHYPAFFTQIIREWRQAFRRDMPVVAAQLPRFGADPSGEDWAAIRESQRKVCDTEPDCALCCLIDCGESGNLHPVDKETPGRRMGRLALMKVYGAGMDAESPRLIRAERTAAGLRLEFSAPLRAPAGHPEVIADGCSLLAPAAGAFAYAWENDPETWLFGAGGLPVFPFQVQKEEFA